MNKRSVNIRGTTTNTITKTTTCAITITNQKTYKPSHINYFSNLRIVSMIPGDREVAGCLSFLFHNFGGIC